ncbi:MAG TPA: hypothetical protein VFU05_06915 [Cyclobacteriaceae bacterium]|nr:hypothetical protein [Cyclobacteriaceae bacterium]
MLPGNQFLKLLFLAIVGLVSSSDAFSQIQQPGRYEKEIKFNDAEFSIISLQTDGLALIREKREFKAGNQTWEIIFLDTALQATDPIEFQVDNKYNIIGFDHAAGVAFLLFTEGDLGRYLNLVAITIKTREVKQYEIKPELSLHLTHFSKVGENFVFGGFVNRESAVLLYSPTTDNLKVIPGFFQKELELVDIRVNQNLTFNTILIDRSENRAKKMILKTFDAFGKQILEDITAIDEDIVLLTSVSSTLEREDLMIAGTWGKANSKQASGFYALPVNPFSDLPVKRVNFGSLEHYLDYLKPAKAAKIKLKSSQASEAGKIPEFMDYVMPFKIVEYVNGFILFAESYVPTNTTSNQYPPNWPYRYNYPYPGSFGGYYPYGNGYYNSQNINNLENDREVKTVESAIVAFDGNGNVLWDYSLPLTSIKMPSLEQVGDFTLVENNIHLLYKDESELKAKTINLDDQEVRESSEKIQLGHPLDELRSESEKVGTVRHWFGKNFYVWGYQSIRNKASTEDRSKQVFYVNKVVVH